MDTYEEMERIEHEIIEDYNSKYDVPDIGDVVIVKFPLSDKERKFIVLRTDYMTSYLESIGEEMTSKCCSNITGLEIGKGIKHVTDFHVYHIREIIKCDKDESDKNEMIKLINSQNPAVGKTAVIRKNSLLRLNKERCKWDKFKIVEIVNRQGLESLLVLRPTKHFNGKYKKLSLGHVYLS